MIKRSVITDEVSQDPGEVIAFAQAFHLDGLELRTICGKGLLEMDDTLIEELRGRFQDAGLAVCCFSLPLFKCDVADLATQEAQIAAFPRLLQYAKALGTERMRGFCFWKCEDPYARLREVYGKIAPMAQDAGITIVLESDPSVNGHTALKLREMIECIDHPAVQALFDGGNYPFVPDAQTPLESYGVLRGKIRHVHVKDSVREGNGAHAVCIGEGEGQVREILSALRDDGYNGWLSLETHYRLDVSLDDETLRLPGGTAFSAGGAAASAQSMRALAAIIDEIWR